MNLFWRFPPDANIVPIAALCRCTNISSSAAARCPFKIARLEVRRTIFLYPLYTLLYSQLVIRLPVLVLYIRVDMRPVLLMTIRKL